MANTRQPTRRLRLEDLEQRALLAINSVLIDPPNIPIGELPPKPSLDLMRWQIANVERLVKPAGLTNVTDMYWSEVHKQIENGPRAYHSLSVHIDGDGRIETMISLDAWSESTLQSLANLGFSVNVPMSHQLSFVGWLPYQSVEAAARLPHVREIDLPGYAITNSGSYASAGDALLQADDVRSTLGFDGTGIKVGVISDGVDGLSTAVASGDLPSNVQVGYNASGGRYEGTAMLEIVHDLAPGASLYFHSALNPMGMLTAINWMTSQGVDVIVDDLTFFTEPYFQDGAVANAVSAAISNGATYVTAAGNAAQAHYQGVFDQGTSDGVGGYFHEFASGDELLTIAVGAGRLATITLQWSDSWGASANDYDLYVTDGVNYWNSTFIQNGGLQRNLWVSLVRFW